MEQKLKEMNDAGISEVCEAGIGNVVPSITSVVAKMQCHGNTYVEQVNDPDNKYYTNVVLGAVWEGSTEAQQMSENVIFGKWTPNAECKMGIRNPDAGSFFKQGKQYYVTFTEADK